jgi:histidinol-phosphate aminotransferase
LKPRVTRRTFLQASAAGLGFISIPGMGYTGSRAGLDGKRENYFGRLCYNENPLGPSPLALEAIRKSAADANRYPDWYSETLESKLAQYHNLPVSAICVGAGATEIIHLIARAFLHAGDEMITASPTYEQMEAEALQNGASVVKVAVDETVTIDLQGIYQAISRKTRLISLVNPNNPLATCVDRAQMRDFVYSVPGSILVDIFS